jgi:FkbM family methyltransferase
MNKLLESLSNIVGRIYYNKANTHEKFIRMLFFIGWQIWKRTVARPVHIQLFNGLRFIAYPDCQTSSSAIYFRIPDYREISLLRRKLNKGLMIDIGANIGLFTLLLGDIMEQVILFEPNPLASKRAKENMDLNHLNAEVYAIAVSSNDGQIFLEDRGGTNSNNMTIRNDKLSLFPIRKVPCTSLDSFMKMKPDLSVAFIKIDVEGHENDVIKGMNNTLIKLRPSMVMFEYLQRTNFLETKTLFDAAGYRIYQIGEAEDLEPVPAQPEPLQNLFALPEELPR